MIMMMMMMVVMKVVRVIRCSTVQSFVQPPPRSSCANFFPRLVSINPLVHQQPIFVQSCVMHEQNKFVNTTWCTLVRA